MKNIKIHYRTIKIF